jgi:hypothetical protein
MTTKHTSKYSTALASALALALLACGGPGNVNGNGDGPTPAPDQPKAPPALAEPAVRYNFLELRTEKDVMASSNYGYLIAKAKEGFNAAGFEKMGLEVLSSFAANGSRYYYLHTDGEVMPILKNARLTPGLMYIEPEFMHYTTEILDAAFAANAADDPEDPPPLTNPITYTPGDLYVNDFRQYGVCVTHTVDAWK